MLYVATPSGISKYACNFEVRFELNERKKVVCSVFARFVGEEGMIFSTFVGHVPLKAALDACGILASDFRKSISENNSNPVSVYRSELRLCWSNYAKKTLKYDDSLKSAVVYITSFKWSVYLSEAAAKRNLVYYGGFSVVSLKYNEVVRIDNCVLSFSPSGLYELSTEKSCEDEKLVDCTSVLRKTFMTAVTVTLF